MYPAWFSRHVDISDIISATSWRHFDVSDVIVTTCWRIWHHFDDMSHSDLSDVPMMWWGHLKHNPTLVAKRRGDYFRRSSFEPQRFPVDFFGLSLDFRWFGDFRLVFDGFPPDFGWGSDFHCIHVGCPLDFYLIFVFRSLHLRFIFVRYQIFVWFP